MGVWSKEHYIKSENRAVEVIEEIEKTRKLPEPRNENYVVIWAQKDTGKAWIEIPDQIADDVWEKVKKFSVVKGIRRGEVGYHFYESAFIEIQIKN